VNAHGLRPPATDEKPVAAPLQPMGGGVDPGAARPAASRVGDQVSLIIKAIHVLPVKE
jgi:hypothetical protein